MKIAGFWKSSHHATMSNLSVPRSNMEKYRESFAYQGPILWNKLPKHITELDSLAAFKCALKDFNFKHVH